MRVPAPADRKDSNDTLIRDGVEIVRDYINTAVLYPVAGAAWVLDNEVDYQTLLGNGLPTRELAGRPSVDRFYAPSAGQLSLVTGIP